MLTRRSACIGLATASLTRVSVAGAEGPQALGPLLARLAGHAARFEEMKRRASFTLAGHIEELDGNGAVDGSKDLVVRFTATPTESIREIVRYLEDGADKTAEAQKKAAARKKSGHKPAGRDVHLPFLASEQSRYVFSLAERDRSNPSLVRVAFHPKKAARDAYKGSAWVDARDGEILSMGFSPSKNPIFVEHIDVTMRFDLRTALGRAPSKLTFEGKGGVLFVRKHFRGSATISDASVAF
jgi:hypothetical protein